MHIKGRSFNFCVMPSALSKHWDVKYLFMRYLFYVEAKVPVKNYKRSHALKGVGLLCQLCRFDTNANCCTKLRQTHKIDRNCATLCQNSFSMCAPAVAMNSKRIRSLKNFRLHSTLESECTAKLLPTLHKWQHHKASNRRNQCSVHSLICALFIGASTLGCTFAASTRRNLRSRSERHWGAKERKVALRAH